MLNKDSIVWINGKFEKFSDSLISIGTHGLHYGTSIFEGCMAYNGVIFKNREHCERFKKSGEAVDIHIKYSVEELMVISNEVVKRNNLKDAYIRPIAWKGDEMLGVYSEKCAVNVAIMFFDFGNKYSEEKVKNGISLGMSDFVRPDPNSVPVYAKVGGQYYISSCAINRAKRAGYDDALMLDYRGYIAECCVSNIFFVKGDHMITPISDCILNGITRQTVFEISKKLGIMCLEERIKEEDLVLFNDAFITGTAIEIVPVSKIFDKYMYRPDLSLRIRQMYLDMVNNRL